MDWALKAGWEGEFDPFRLNETASVSALANAAVRARFVALTEYVAYKRKPGRGRPYGLGRCDLWVGDTATGGSYAIEFKYLFASSNGTANTIESRLEAAVNDARAVPGYEAEYRAGCLIIATQSETPDQSIIDRLDRQSAATGRYAFRVGGGRSPAWLLFEMVA